MRMFLHIFSELQPTFYAIPASDAPSSGPFPDPPKPPALVIRLATGKPFSVSPWRTALYQRALVYSDLGRNSEARADIKQAARFIGSDAALIEAQEVQQAPHFS